MKKLKFTTAGIPLTTSNRSTINGLKQLKNLGLDGMEMEFVHGVRLSEDKAKEVGNLSKKLNLVLTAHGPYYINLNAKDLEKVNASIKRIYDTAKISKIANAYSITFHAGFYLKQSKEKVYQTIKSNLSKVIEQLKQENNDIYVRPELTGKETQFGDIDEIISLSEDLDNVLPCIDFAHYYARSVGKNNTYDSFRRVLDKIEKNLGNLALKNMHIHLSGIAYSLKGETHHETLKQTKFNWKAVIKVLHDYDVKGIVVSESPVIEHDALIMKHYFERL